MKTDWKKLATNLLKAELTRRGLSYDELQKKLQSIGVKETANSINVKINRGTFSFAFFLQVMRAIEAKNFRVGEE
jgi:hypothetical protein